MLWACHHSPGRSGTAHSSRPFRHRHSLRTSQAHSFRTAQSLSQFTATLCYSLSTPTHTPNDKAQNALSAHRHSLRTSQDHSFQAAQSLSLFAATHCNSLSTLTHPPKEAPLPLLVISLVLPIHLARRYRPLVALPSTCSCRPMITCLPPCRSRAGGS